MKRDMDVVREILLRVETDAKAPYTVLRDLKIEGRSANEIAYHVMILNEAGYLNATISHLVGGGTQYFVHALTWKGHEFLDTIRDQEIWRKTKDGASKIGGASIEFVWEIAKAYGKHIVKEKLGLELP